jgi:hypothetical protein
VETNKIEEIYSFKAMLRILYQSGVIILKKFEEAATIPKIEFLSTWILVAGQLISKEENKECEEASLIEVAECLILFEESIKWRRMLETSRLKPTSATSPSSGEGTQWCILHPTTLETPRRWQRLRPFNGAKWESCLRSLTVTKHFYT